MMNGTQYWYLKDHQLFRSLNSLDLKEICFMAKYKVAKKGEIIFFSDENEGLVFTLKHGSLKIVRISEDGNEIVKDVLKKGDLFGQLSLGDDVGTETEYAVVLSDSVVFCSFIASEFEKILGNKPEIGIKYTKWMGVWFKRLENRYANLMFKDVRERLVCFFKDLVIDLEPDKDGFYVVQSTLTHQDVASLTCSTRQTITSLLNTLKAEGLIEYDRKEIKISSKLFV